ncbi:unnamed protein product [Dicrocoelium dendriticum]|nr:unnamed protein product [Dicrocoelium dendriticum]
MNKRCNVVDLGVQVVHCKRFCIVDTESFKDANRLCAEAGELLHENSFGEEADMVNIDSLRISEDDVLDAWIKESFVCAICRGLLVRSRVLACGHHFCRECILKWFTIRQMCPMCRRPGRVNTPSLGIDRFLDDVVESSSCKWLKMQRMQRKREEANTASDRYEERVSEPMTTTSSHFPQTIFASTHGISNTAVVATSTYTNWVP